ncbi:lipopolysaccharide biosynthesis protein [Sphingosinicella sp. CPCC 101087]|uniref:lipopolysaccharide biosynthesis protein n=1 Tax=Sphingosinicella sp. CPCC 101087 TaxID=2497754 RepID=UPI001FB116F1|nr:lipopolysaccharide biosynthesis protein [Sphingosinicella sp. CPCC 101087]
MAEADNSKSIDTPAKSLSAGFAQQVKGAVIWRSGSQIAGQLIAWTSTFLVIRMLEPTDYGLVAMTGVVLAFLDLFNGWGFASALVRDDRIDSHRIGQVFGMLLLMNGSLAAIQWIAAPIAADYFNQPMVADLLRIQALFFLATPFTALGNALLIRRMDFRRQSQVNLIAAVLSAFTALGCAFAGLGVWTLVAAPFVLWYARAIGLAIAARLWIRPVFRFAGAGAMARYGGAMILVQFCWFVQSQADVFIAGRLVDAHRLGLYTTALFLTQILAAKFVPPLNEVAFAAYSRIQGEREMMRAAFLKTVRLIMLVALPFYFGLIVTAEPLVLVILGEKWSGAATLVPVLACAMPLMTLQILFAPATNAIGRPGLAVRTGLIGAVLMSATFLAGIQWGTIGLAWGWVAGMAALLAATILISLPAIGVGRRALAGAVAPGLAASAAMAAGVAALDSILSGLGDGVRLATLVPFGAALYAALLFLFARPVIDEMIALVRPQTAAT